VSAATPTLLDLREGFSLPPGGPLSRVWAGLDFAPARSPYPATAAFAARLRRLYGNGGAWFASFKVPADPTLRWYACRGRLDEVGFFDRFWHAPSVPAALPDLGDRRGRPREPFALMTSFTLDGELAAALFAGGAYSLYRGTAAAAKRAGRRVARELIGERYDEVYVHACHRPWCNELDGMVVTWTWVVLDLRAAVLHVLCAADVD
jgi:hypothetical protein